MRQRIYNSFDKLAPLSDQEATLEHLIHKATLPSNKEIDWNIAMEVIDFVNFYQQTGNRYLKQLNHRLLENNINIQIQTVQLIEISVKNCGVAFHQQLAESQLLKTLTSLGKPKAKVSEDVQRNILSMMEDFSRMLPQNEFRNAFTKLITEGALFLPRSDQQKAAPFNLETYHYDYQVQLPQNAPYVQTKQNSHATDYQHNFQSPQHAQDNQRTSQQQVQSSQDTRQPKKLFGMNTFHSKAHRNSYDKRKSIDLDQLRPQTLRNDTHDSSKLQKPTTYHDTTDSPMPWQDQGQQFTQQSRDGALSIKEQQVMMHAAGFSNADIKSNISRVQKNKQSQQGFQGDMSSSRHLPQFNSQDPDALSIDIKVGQNLEQLFSDSLKQVTSQGDYKQLVADLLIQLKRNCSQVKENVERHLPTIIDEEVIQNGIDLSECIRNDLEEYSILMELYESNQLQQNVPTNIFEQQYQQSRSKDDEYYQGEEGFKEGPSQIKQQDNLESNQLFKYKKHGDIFVHPSREKEQQVSYNENVEDKIKPVQQQQDQNLQQVGQNIDQQTQQQNPDELFQKDMISVSPNTDQEQIVQNAVQNKSQKIGSSEGHAQEKSAYQSQGKQDNIDILTQSIDADAYYNNLQNLSIKQVKDKENGN